MRTSNAQHHFRGLAPRLSVASMKGTLRLYRDTSSRQPFGSTSGMILVPCFVGELWLACNGVEAADPVLP